jgi:hypothetical protein
MLRADMSFATVLRVDMSFATQSYNIYDLSIGEPGEQINPSYRLVQDEAQQLFDDFYRAGLRPSEIRNTAGELSATRAHLDHVSILLDRVLPLALRRNIGGCR